MKSDSNKSSSPTKPSLLAQSKKKKHKSRFWVWGFLFLLFLGGGYAWYTQKNLPIPQTSIQTAFVERGDLKISFEGEGKIMNPDMVNLSFFMNGTLAQVLVQEGDRVKKGDVLARLDKRELEFDLQEALSQVEVIRTNIKAKESTITDESLKTVSNDLIISQKNLEITRQELQKNLDQAFDLGLIQLETTFPEIKNALKSIDNLWGIDQKNARYASVVHIFNDAIKESLIKNQYQTAQKNYEDLWKEYKSLEPLKNEDISRMLWKSKILAEEVKIVLENIIDLFHTQKPVSSRVSDTEIEQAQNSISSSLGKINSEILTLTNSRQKIENAYINQQNGTLQAENNLQSVQLKLKNTELSTQVNEINKETSLSVLYAQLAQAQVKVEKVRYNLGLTTLISPIDGEIIAVNASSGESVKTESTSSENALIRIMSDHHFTTEIYVEEIDIVQVHKGQSVYITLDAFPEKILQGEVSYISSIAEINNNGITTYLVRIEIKNTEDIPIREGMSTNVEFIIEEKQDVLFVPQKSVVNNRVQRVDKTPVSVEIGMSDGRYVEIRSGLEEGQEILLTPFVGRSSSPDGTSPNAPSSSSEDRFSRIEKMLIEQDNLPEGWETMTEEEKQESLNALRESGTIPMPGMGGGGGAGRP